MVQLKLEKYEYAFDNSSKYLMSIQKPIVFYKIHKEDKRKLFLTFVILDISKGKITYLFSYTKENIDIIQHLQNEEKYYLMLVPHSTIEINEKKDFFVFLQEEQFFLYVNYRDNILRIYTMEDIIDEDISFKKISSTFYKDDIDNNFFYMAASDYDNNLHIYRVSLDLKMIDKIDSFPGKNIPPHVVRKNNNCLLLSHEFNEANYLLKKLNKTINSQEMGTLLVKNSMRINMANPGISSEEMKGILYNNLKQKYDISCLPGKVIIYDLFTKERIDYQTSGGSPAHFEIDKTENMVYVSSHNFFNRLDSMSFFGPAVFDKFLFRNNRLTWCSSFSYEKGYRYASHRVFYNNGVPYICTFGQANRLIFVDARSMQLFYYDDIGTDELSDKTDVEMYLNTRESGGEFAALEVSQDGKNILFLDNKYIYIYNFEERKLCHKIEYRAEEKEDWDQYILRTLHITFLQ